MALVVFTSGIVDERPTCVRVGLSTTQSLCGAAFRGGCGTWPAWGWGSLGTLLSPEASAVRQVASVARQDRIAALSPPLLVGGVVVGLGGCVSCELDSGREHLLRQTTLSPSLVRGVGCGVSWMF